MTAQNSTQPMVEITRGGRLESLHRGVIAVVDAGGHLVASLGQPKHEFFTRSAAKPFQALAFVCSGAADAFAVTDEELAVICGSHSGEARHVELVESLLQKTGLSPEQLQCGLHPPFDTQVRRALYEERRGPSVLQNNCSGKHLAMLATARHLGLTLEDYLHPEHGVQVAIRGLLAFLAGLEPEEIELGVDGCGAPAHHLPLRSFALAMARLAAAGEGIASLEEDEEELEDEVYDEDESASGDEPAGEGAEALPVPLSSGLARVWNAMKSHPVLVAGSRGRIDTDLMRVAAAHRVPLVAKSGAEGVYAIATVRDREAYGIVVKVEDGAERARNCACLEALYQLQILPEEAFDALSGYHQPVVLDRRDDPVGEVNPIFKLNRGLPG